MLRARKADAEGSWNQLVQKRSGGAEYAGGGRQAREVGAEGSLDMVGLEEEAGGGGLCLYSSSSSSRAFVCHMLFSGMQQELLL